MKKTIAKIAVSAATYPIDKPYDYIVPTELCAEVAVGVRVIVPFSRGNRPAEGIVLGISEGNENEKLKYVTGVIDKAPVLSADMVSLAIWMHERFFCTVYDAVKAMLPAGLSTLGKSAVRRIKDKTVSFATLSIPAEDALAISAVKRRSAPSQSAVLDFLSAYGGALLQDIRDMTGAATTTINKLERDGYLSIEKREVFRRPEYKVGDTAPLPSLNPEQQAAFDGIFDLTRSGQASAALLYGVTGSGKTAVYIHLIYQLQQQGKGSVLLVPEISLTPQMLHTFSSHFGDSIAVIHSSLSMGERYDEWKRIKNGDASVVIGTRSAIFAPIENLGIIIIDEEQEDSYKSENSPRYNAIDVAKYRCAKAGAPLLLGSATPNIQTNYHARTGRYSLFNLPERYNELSLPRVKIVDMKKELRSGNGSNLSALLVSELRQNIEKGEQSILFLNRRGMNKLISCGECGFTYKCPHCSVSLTYHSMGNRLMCHHCGFSQRVDGACPDCDGKLNYVGAGTQKIVEELAEHFPDTPVLRMDADTVSRLGSHEAILEQFREDEIPIMVGTQMVTKGLDFPKVTLVGVISADQSLYSGDFRASERTFSLITQVVGRSGRGEVSGRAIIQTFTPENEVIKQAAMQDYDSFYTAELELRRIQWCPPFSDLFTLTATGLDEDAVLRCLIQVRNIFQDRLNKRPDLRILGPAPLPVVRVNNRYRYRLTLACRDDKEVRDLISAVIIHCAKNKEFKGVSVFGDINPN